MLVARVRRTLVERELVARGDHVLVGCSGGPDSTALVHVLEHLSSELGITIGVASVDHGLRPEAKREVEGVRVLAEALDLPFVALMSSTALLALCWALLSSGLPLWLQRHSVAPVWLAPLAVLAGSLLIALFQVRVSRQGERLVGAVRSSWRSSGALALCCVFFAAAAWPSSVWLAALVVVLGTGLHVVGELYYVAARWGMSLKLMAKGAEGQYQAVAATTEGAVVALGPALVTTLVTGAHAVGWMVLALLFVACSAPVASLCRAMLRRSPAH